MSDSAFFSNNYPKPVGAQELDPEILQVWPLTAPYQRAQQHHGFATVEEAAQCLLYCARAVPAAGETTTPSGGTVDFNYIAPGNLPVWVPSSRLGGNALGPTHQHDVMVIGKMPGREELTHGRSFCGPSGTLLADTARAAGVEGVDDWYCGNVIRFLPGRKSDKINAEDVRDCLPLLAHDIAYARPKFILLVGADALKVFFGRDATLSKLRSQVFVIPDWRAIGHPPKAARDSDILDCEYTIRVFVTIHPAAVLREQGLLAGFQRDLELFNDLLGGANPMTVGSADMQQRAYVTVRSGNELKAVVDFVLASGAREVSVDCEWIGSDPYTGSLRTVQFGWDRGHACVAVFKKAGGADACSITEQTRMLDELRRLLLHSNMGIIGHNARADAKWLTNAGIDISRRISFDTMLADHILNENAEHGLDSCALRYTDMGRYDWKLSKWLGDHGLSDKKIKKAGFKDVPDDILEEYACCDADATWRCKQTLTEMLNRPENAHPKWCYYNVVMPCTLPLHEIETRGILIDRDRMESMVWAYDEKKDSLLADIRQHLNRPKFNPRSYKQMTALLFSTKANNGLDLPPYKTTGKPAKMWEDLREDERRAASPSTDAESIEWIAAGSKDPLLNKLRDFKVIDQMTKSFLRKPDDKGVIEDGMLPFEEEEEYSTGLMGCIDPDGRIRTSINQMSETGRHRSSDPNCQNLPKKQDKEFDRIMGKGTPKIRSCFISAPGNVLIEADFKSAEIYTLGYLANCPKLIKDAGGDLHARGAVTRMGVESWPGFDQYIPPPEEWLSKNKALRIANKTVSFGIPYQRGPKAIAREITKSTKGAVECSKDQAQSMIDDWYGEYTEVYDYVQMCKASVKYPSYLDNPFGRRRRFSFRSSDQAFVAAQEREAVNFPIQSTVADILNVGLARLYWLRFQMVPAPMYKILLAIHDAVLLEVPGEHVRAVIDTVLPRCLHDVVAPSWQPREDLTPTKPFQLDIDVSVCVRWGETPSADELLANGVPEDLVAKYATKAH